MMKWEKGETQMLILDVRDYVAQQINSESITGDEAGDGWGLFFLSKI